jgi:hypothetical protein
MQPLTFLVLALLLAAGGTTALADGDGDRSGDGRAYRHGFDRERWLPVPRYRGAFPGAGDFQRPGYNRYDYDPLDAALIGGAILYGRYPDPVPDNIPRYNPNYSPPTANGAEVVGCYRIERFPDGTERRVELPVAVCR